MARERGRLSACCWHFCGQSRMALPIHVCPRHRRCAGLGPSATERHQRLTTKRRKR
jgi:hypothetical protein